MKRLLAYFLIFFSLLGILDAGFLTWEKLSNSTPPCNAAFKCGEVLNSPWSSIGPIPLSVFGIIFYAIFLVLGSLLFIGKEELHYKQFCLSVRKLVLLLGVFGIIFSTYLMIIMGVVLEAWCLYCLLSALNCLILFILSSFVFRKFRKE